MKKMISNSVNKSVSVFLLTIAVAFFGVFSFLNTPVELLPDLDFPFVVVSSVDTGKTPEEIEEGVIIPIENAVRKTQGASFYDSTAQPNFGVVFIEIDQNRDLSSFISELRENLTQNQNSFSNSSTIPSIETINPDDFPVMVFSISSNNMTRQELFEWGEIELSPLMKNIKGVDSIRLSGGFERKIHIEIKEEEIENYNSLIPSFLDFKIDEEFILKHIKGQHFNSLAGFGKISSETFLVRVGSEFQDLEELKNSSLIDLLGTPIKLKDVAEITVSYESNVLYNKVDGDNAITATIRKTNEANTVEVINLIEKALGDIEEDFSITILVNQGDYIRQSISSVMNNLVIGGLLALSVLFFFLKNLKTSFIAGVVIPISLLLAISLMFLTSITFNVISLGGLALGIGMLVDNSIVVIENILRMKEKGVFNKEAALYGTYQVSGAITTSTLTTIGVFLPIIFAENLVRQIFLELALTVSFSLFASLIISLTLVPALSSKILKNKEKGDLIQHKENIVKKAYEKLLKKVLANRKKVVFSVLIIFAFSFRLILSQGFEFFPAVEENEMSFTIEYVFSEHDTGEEIEEKFDDLTKSLKKLPFVDSLGIRMNRSEITSPSGTASLNITLSERREFKNEEISLLVIEKIEKQGENLKAFVNLSANDINNIIGSGIQIIVKGEDFLVIDELVNSLKEKLVLSKMIEETSVTGENDEKEIIVEVDKSKVYKYYNLITLEPLTVEDVWGMIAGQINIPENETVVFGRNEYTVVFGESNGSEQSLETIEDFSMIVVGVNPFTSELVHLKDVATIKLENTPSFIQRVNGTRYKEIGLSLDENFTLTEAGREVESILKDFETPVGYEIEVVGENEEIIETIDNLIFVGFLAVLVVFSIMGRQFKSFKHPFIIIFMIPMAFSGGFISLWIFGMKLSVVSVFGFIILSGIVVNNGIVLIDYINQLIDNGKKIEDAVIEGGKTRLRPIVMTSLTTILALSVLAFVGGEGTEIMRPLAVSSTGGLIYSTFLTLFVIPVLYLQLSKKRPRKKTVEKVEFNEEKLKKL